MKEFLMTVFVLGLACSLSAQEPITGCPKIIFLSSQVMDITCGASSKFTHHYFSSTLDSPIYQLDNKQLKLHTDSSTYAAMTADARSKRREISLYMFALKTKLTENHLWGGGFEIKLYLKNKWSTGIFLGVAGRRITDTFTFLLLNLLLAMQKWAGLINTI